MKIDPYVSVDGVPFTLTPVQARQRWGAPLSAVRNAVDLLELDYGDAVYRFQDSGRLEEVTRAAPVVEIGKIAMPFAALAGFVAAQDPAAFERHGFRISPRYGLAFVPDEPSWVTALAAHCLDSWLQLPQGD